MLRALFVLGLVSVANCRSFGFIGDSLTCALGENIDNANICGSINGQCFPYWQQHAVAVMGFPHRLTSILGAEFSSRGCFPGATSRDVLNNGNVETVANDTHADTVVILLGANDCGDGVQNSTAMDYNTVVTTVAQAKHGRTIFLMDNPWDGPQCQINYSWFTGTWNSWIGQVQKANQGINGANILRLHTGWNGVTLNEICKDCNGHPMGVGYTVIAQNLAKEIQQTEE